MRRRTYENVSKINEIGVFSKLNSFRKRVILKIEKDFFTKERNEELIECVMKQFFEGTWIKGDPNKKEPDRYCGDIPFEFTLASTRNKKGNLFRNLKELKPNERWTSKISVLEEIEKSIKSKASKTYSVDNVHLCVLTIKIFDNWFCENQSVFRELFQNENSNCKNTFIKWKKDYIDNKKFGNIFIICQTSDNRWWIINLKKLQYAEIENPAYAELCSAVSRTPENNIQ